MQIHMHTICQSQCSFRLWIFLLLVLLWLLVNVVLDSWALCLYNYVLMFSSSLCSIFISSSLCSIVSPMKKTCAVVIHHYNNIMDHISIETTTTPYN
eukprot:UN13544